MQITVDIFKAYLKCPTKCFLRAHNEMGTGNAYADWVRTETEVYRSASIKRLTEGTSPDECVTELAGTKDLKTAKWRLALDVTAQTRNLESRIHAIERIPSEGRGKAAQFIPVRFVFRNKLTKDDKLLSAFDAVVLSEILGRPVSIGEIIHGNDYSTLKVKTLGLRNRVGKVTEKIVALLSTDAAPDLVLNRHCGECEFQTRCRQKAVEKDDLSLLSNMSEKERKKLNSKGIFTVTQLSYTFRPRRRPKRLRDKREKYHHSLKALAIREKKIHIVGTPELKIEGTPVYFDVEGLPDRDFYYLIGVRIGNGESVVQHSLWADTQQDEGRIWRGFVDILKGIDRPILIHYGSYETTFLRRMSERYREPLEGSVVAKALKCPLNLPSWCFAQIYFPTHSNRLKDVGAWLSVKWSSANPSGTQSIIWRMNWERSISTSAKQDLITYNSEDCRALEVLTGLLLRVCNPHHDSGTKAETAVEVAVADSATSPDSLWKRFASSIANFEAINKAARWDYQRDRIYIRTDRQLRSIASARQTHANRALPVNKRVRCDDLHVCPFCGREPDRQYRPRRLVLYNLRFSNAGLKRWVVEYRFHYYWCGSCHKRFGRPKEFWPHSDFGRNVVVFVIYQVIELCVPQMTAAKSLARLFGLKIADSVLNSFKASAAAYYAETRTGILARITKGILINADETPIPLKDRRGYVWVFASMHEVVYLYADTREGDMLREKLKAFKGVLVSDFYTAYDSISCPQQKCLLHLMRDLNEAVLANPYDAELKQIATGFGEFLKAVVETIDRRGLKRRFLRKHVDGVERFYQQIEKVGCQSEIALKWKERFEHNRNRLFTFLNYDGVPWNNNNAEHAIKAFARLRRVITGLSSPKGIEDYLNLLSVCQTCKYQGLDFLDFLRSGEKDIEVFAQTRRRRR